MSTETMDKRAAYMRRYREEHREHLLEIRRARYHAEYGGKVRDDACRTDGLTAQQRWRMRHKDEINARKMAEREAAAKAKADMLLPDPDAVQEPQTGKNAPVRHRGRVCTDCTCYLVSPLCSASFFEVVSCGIRIAETCVNYDGKTSKCRKKITAAKKEEPQQTQNQTIMSETKDQKEETAPVAPSKEPEAVRTYNQQYYEEHREEVLARQRAAYAADPERQRERKRRERAARREREREEMRADVEAEVKGDRILAPSVIEGIRAALEVMRASGMQPVLRLFEAGMEITVQLPEGGAR